jgi:hypothetical protein
MRLNIAFLTLLVTATLAAGLELKEFPLARDGDVIARAIAFGIAPVLAISVGLLTRIVSRVDAVRRAGKETSR